MVEAIVFLMQLLAVLALAAANGFLIAIIISGAAYLWEMMK